jgi:HPt (histidine-containing phosphotransfer) domain-containing protein
MAGNDRPSGTIMPRVDRAVLDSLIEIIGQESVRAFLAEFQDLAAQQRFAIQAAHEAGDLEALYREAHNLVSTAGNLGIKRTSDRADQVQRAARTHDTNALDKAVESLLVELDAVVDDLPGLVKAASQVA